IWPGSSRATTDDDRAMPLATGSRQRCSPSQAPCDQKLHDLIGAGIDTRHPGVTIHSRDRKFVHVAIPTKKLQATVDDFSLQVGQPILGHGGGNRIERAGKVAFDAMVVKHACDCRLRLALGKSELGILEFDELLAESLSLLYGFDGDCNRP